MSISGTYDELWNQHYKIVEILRRVVSPSRAFVPAAAKTHPIEPAGQPRGQMTLAHRIALAAGPLVCALVGIFIRPDGLSAQAAVVLGVTAWMAIWWISECVPLPVTGLVPILVFPMSGAMSSSETFSAYGNNIIYLFLGGFLIAGALEKWDLHRRMAVGIIKILGTSVQSLILGFMFATGFLSFFVTNTAAAMMMVPMGMAIVAQVKAIERHGQQGDVRKFERALLFGIGYSATIAGIGTVLGGTSIPVFIAQAEIFAGVQISFAQYVAFGLPFSIVFMMALWVYLTKIKFRMKMKTIPGGRQIVDEQHAALGRMSREEKSIAAVGALIAALWILRAWIVDPFVSDMSDGVIAILGAVILFALPSRSEKSPRILVWEDTKKTPWGILLLIGGGLALAQAFSNTGLSDWVGDQFLGLSELPFLIAMVLIVTVLVFLTEFTSTSATALLFVPLMGTVAISLGYDPLITMLAATMAVNCAFMLPAATPPNSIIYGTGLITIREMVRTGFAISVVGIVLIIAFVSWWAPVIF